MRSSDRARPDNEVKDATEGMWLTSHPDGRSLRADGVSWSVYEDRSDSLGPSLIFESDKIARRVRGFPANWRQLTDAQLIALSWSR
jgi:hypothetical protein